MLHYVDEKLQCGKGGQKMIMSSQLLAPDGWL